METLTLINGNRQQYTIDLPRIHIIAKEINETALSHVSDRTGLDFKPCWRGYEAQPVRASQITALLLTWNFKTRYYNNADATNTLMLKFDHHIGFDVDSICFECVKHNHVHVGDLTPGDRLAC